MCVCVVRHVAGKVLSLSLTTDPTLQVRTHTPVCVVSGVGAEALEVVHAYGSPTPGRVHFAHRPVCVCMRARGRSSSLRRRGRILWRLRSCRVVVCLFFKRFFRCRSRVRRYGVVVFPSVFASVFDDRTGFARFPTSPVYVFVSPQGVGPIQWWLFPPVKPVHRIRWTGFANRFRVFTVSFESNGFRFDSLAFFVGA